MPLSSFSKHSLKISLLQNLTTLLCDYESFKTIQHICHLPNVSFGELCEQSQSHEQLLHAIELSSEVVTNVLNGRRVSKELWNVLIGDATDIQAQMKWWGSSSKFGCHSILFMKLYNGFLSSLHIPKFVVIYLFFLQFRFQENVPEIAFFQEIPQYMTALNSMLNITENLTDSSIPGSLLYFFAVFICEHHHWHHNFYWKSQDLFSCY